MTATVGRTHGIMRGLDRRMGDTRHSWDKGKPDEVAAARAQFDEHVSRKGYKAFTKDPATGEFSVPMKSFDPAVEDILLVPQLVGG